jgi:hypothetical protein
VESLEERMLLDGTSPVAPDPVPVDNGTYNPESRYNKHIDELYVKLNYYRNKMGDVSRSK